MDEFIKIIRKHQLMDGDILLIDWRSGIDPTQIYIKEPKLLLIMVDGIENVKHIALGGKREPV